MRRLLTGLVVAVTTAVVPVLASAENQEVADRIAKSLRDSGQMSDYKIGVKYQDGTAWLRGRVRSQEQMNAALKLVFQTPGVTRLVNGMTIGSSAKGKASPAATTARFGKTETLRNGTAANTANPVRSGSVAIAPDQMSIAQRLQRAIGGGTSAQGHRAERTMAPLKSTGRAQRLATSFSPTPAEPVAATVPRQPAKVAPRMIGVSTAGGLASGAVPRVAAARIPGRPIPIAYTQAVGEMPAAGTPGGPIPAYVAGVGGGVAPARYDQPHLPNYSWPSYAAYPNYAALTYPRQYSPTAWPFIGPFYPYPQVPLGWRKVTLEWDDGWWMLDFEDAPTCAWCAH